MKYLRKVMVAKIKRDSISPNNIYRIYRHKTVLILWIYTKMNEKQEAIWHKI